VNFFFAGNAAGFTEERTKTTEREKSFCHWPHQSPSRIDMLTSGWFLEKTKGEDFTKCSHCDVECDNWEPNDNPLRIHRGWSPSCPYILASHPIHPSLIPIKDLDKVFTHEKIATEAVKPMSNIILLSDSSYSRLPERQQSFSTFPGGEPQNVDALIRSGFYYVKISTLIRCFYCGLPVDDFHQHPANEINARHHNHSPKCRYAQMLLKQTETRSSSKFIYLVMKDN
jgi:hypothetical protein